MAAGGKEKSGASALNSTETGAFSALFPSGQDLTPFFHPGRGMSHCMTRFPGHVSSFAIHNHADRSTTVIMLV